MSHQLIEMHISHLNDMSSFYCEWYFIVVIEEKLENIEAMEKFSGLAFVNLTFRAYYVKYNKFICH